MNFHLIFSHFLGRGLSLNCILYYLFSFFKQVLIENYELENCSIKFDLGKFCD